MASTQRPNPVDPAWSPHVLVSRRLRDAYVTNASRLSERSTIEASSNENQDPVNNYVVHPLAQIALARSSCPQPPLDDGITGGGSSVSCDVHYSGMNVRLDPLERAAPHKIVVPFEDNDYMNGMGHTTSLRGDLDGTADVNLAEVRSSTWDAINALSSLCEEVNEINDTFHSQILPSIILFSADDSLAPQQSQQTISKTDIFDDDAQKGRESQLLSRMGNFMPGLQMAQNGTSRLRRLVKNMVCQLGGCATPAAIPFYFDGEHSEEDLTPNNSVGAASDAKKAKQGHSTQSPVFGEGVPMFRLGKAIGVALRLLITVDSAIASNEDLQHAWAMYKDVVMEWSEQKRSDDELDEEFESFERMMVQLDFSLMSSRSFIAAIEQNFDPRGRFQEAKYHVHEEIRHILTTLYAQTCERINTEDETTERLDCVGVYAMYVLYRHLLPPNVVPDAKLHKSLWSVFPVMCPIMSLFGPLHFLPREFMMLHAPYEAVRGCSADSSEIREAAAALVLKWDGSFKARVDSLRLSALGWLAMADSELSPTVVEGYPRYDDNDDIVDGSNFTQTTSLNNIQSASSYILHGVKIAHSASILLRGQLLTHKALGLEHDSSHIPSMLSLIEILKAIEKMLRVRRRSAVLSLQRSTLKMIASNILKIFEKVRSFVDQRSASTTQGARSIARVSACLSTIEGILKGSSSFSPIRRHAVAFSIAASLDPMILENVISTDDLHDVESYLKDLNHFAAIEETLYHECDCSFLYFYRDLFPAFVQSLYKSSQGSALTHTQSVFSALSDPERILIRVRHLDRNVSIGLTPSASNYHTFVTKIIHEEYIEPICELIETDLRFAVYSKNSDSKRNANDRFAAGVRKLITAPPLYICRKKIDVGSEIESYLEKTFYNLSTVSLNDCNNYTEMRSIANERYGLNLVDPSLPDGSLDQGLDFIDVLRNLESFVSTYNYNMIEQNFVQRKVERGAKSLRTLGVKSVASSLKQHGLGVVSLTIDVCYMLLSQKIELLLDFLSDDSIKSLLSKELRWIGNQRKEGNNVYPFDRALEFTQEMKRLLEQSQSKQNGLDWCRSVITEMGNTLAMARMVRTSRRKVLSDEMPFLSPIDVSAIKGVDKSAVKVGTGKNILSHTTGEVEDNIAAVLDKPDPDIVQGFTGLFQEALQGHEGSFISGFHCMLPALCLCWMDASLQGKEMMHKKNIARGGYYTDDGFAVGLAFILYATDQRKMYERLNWFKSIQNKYASDEEDMMERMTAEEMKKEAKIAAAKQSSWFSSSGVDAAQEDSEELKNLKLMEKRIEGNRRELAMLFFSMNEATAFLRSF